MMIQKLSLPTRNIWVKLQSLQCCQFSRIIQETPEFGPYLLVSRLEYEISRIFTEICHSVVDSTFQTETYKYFALLELFYC